MIHSRMNLVLRMALMISLCLLAGSSCSMMQRVKGKTQVTATEKPLGVFQYSALAGMASNKMPTRVYLFPPLRSDAKGKPVEPLNPVQNAEGAIIDWKAPSGASASLLKVIAKRMREMGFEVVDFKTVSDATTPYSILAVSSFYTSEAVLKDAPAGAFNRSQTVMIKASLFDLNLDPKTKIDMMKVDGSLNYSTERPLANPLERTFDETMRWFGDNVQGSVILK